MAQPISQQVQGNKIKCPKRQRIRIKTLGTPLPARIFQQGRLPSQFRTTYLYLKKSVEDLPPKIKVISIRLAVPALIYRCITRSVSPIIYCFQQSQQKDHMHNRSTWCSQIVPWRQLLDLLISQSWLNIRKKAHRRSNAIWSRWWSEVNRTCQPRSRVVYLPWSAWTIKSPTSSSWPCPRS